MQNKFEQQIAKEFKNHKHYATSMAMDGKYGTIYRDRKGQQITWSQYTALVDKDILRRTKRIIDKLTRGGRP